MAGRPPPGYFGTPRAYGESRPSSSQFPHSPVVSRTDSDFPPLSPRSYAPMSPYAPPHPYDSRAAPYGSPYRSGRGQTVHRGIPPFSTRGASMAAAGTPRSVSYAEARSGFAESPYSHGRSFPLHRRQLGPSSAGPAPWNPPSPNEELRKKQHPEEEGDRPGLGLTPSRDEKERTEEGIDDDEDKGGDPLALLAKVSSDMESKPGHKKSEDASAPPTSPLRRTTRTSPVITPTTDNTSSGKRKAEVQVNPSFPEVPAPPRNTGAPPHAKGPKAVTPMPPYYHPPSFGEDSRAPPPYHYSGPPPSRNAPGYQPYGPPPHRAGSGPPPSWHRGTEADYGPHLVERHSHSFDSHDSLGSHDSSLPPPARRYYGPPPSGPPPPYGPPSSEWSMHPPSAGGPPPPGYGPSRYGGGSYGAPPPGPPRPSDPYSTAAPYPYAQQPHPDEKTILRRKFSWKHYPELERFLIANRDDYLEHSSKNYTAEQKQYNNWLTEQLLAVAEQNHYMFDPEEFNFVAIRDRIRCYYKSYVQTARKRGLELPGRAHIKKHRPANSLDKYAEEKDKKQREEKEKTDKAGAKSDGSSEDESERSTVKASNTTSKALSSAVPAN